MHKIYTQNLVNLPLDKTPASRACERPAQTKKTEVAYRMALTSVFWSIAGNLAIDIGRISRALQFPTFWRCSSTASPTYLVISAGLSCQLSSLDDTILTRYLIRLSSVSLIFFCFSRLIVKPTGEAPIPKRGCIYYFYRGFATNISSFFPIHSAQSDFQGCLFGSHLYTA